MFTSSSSIRTSLPRSHQAFLHCRKGLQFNQYVGGHARRLTAARSSGSEKSWSEILGSAAEVARDVASKVKDSVEKALAPESSKSSQPAPKQQEAPPSPSPSLSELPALGGFLGRAVGGMLVSAVSKIGEEIAKAAQESSSVYDMACERIVTSSKLRARLGQVRVGPAISQSSSSMYINGVSSKRVTLIIPVYGASGQQAQAQVDTQEAGGVMNCSVLVQMPEGDVMVLEGSGGRGGSIGGEEGVGQTIDVEYREVK